MKGNIVVNAERLVSVLKEMAVCKACQLGTLQLFKKSAKSACTKLVQAVLSNDGAYQVRSGKSGGEFSTYCFASAISIDMGKVVAYEVGCNSCRECTLYGNKLREEITEEEH